MSTFQQPVWPSREAFDAFDIRSLEGNLAVRIVEAGAAADGISGICGNFPVPTDLQIADSETPKLMEDIGSASQLAVQTEVQRLHPGDPHDEEAIKYIWGMMIEHGIQRGRDEAKERGCEAAKRTYVAFWQMLRAWRADDRGRDVPPV
jgi:hypothetical protein